MTDVKLFRNFFIFFGGILQTLWTIVVVLVSFFGALNVISLVFRMFARFFFRSSTMSKESNLELNEIENGNRNTMEGEGNGAIDDSDNVKNLVGEDEGFRWTKAARRNGSRLNFQEGL